MFVLIGMLLFNSAHALNKPNIHDSSLRLYRFGVLYMLSGNLEDAEELFKASCERGEELACREQKTVAERIKTKKTAVDGEPSLRCYDNGKCFDLVTLFHGDFSKKCESGDQSACVKHAAQLFSENKKDAAEALFQKACDSGNQNGCIGFGMSRADSYKWDTAKTYFKKACDAGNMSGCEKLGEAEMEHGKKEDAKAPLKKGCDSGNLASCYHLARWEASDGGDKKAEELHKENCNKGFVYSCFSLKNEKQDLATAIETWYAACDKKDYLACGYYSFVLNELNYREKGNRIIGSSSSGTITLVTALISPAGAAGAAGAAAASQKGLLKNKPKLFGF